MSEKVSNIAAENPFLRLLAQLDTGRVVTDLTEDYPKVVEAVKRTGVAGSLTITLTIKPDGKGEVETVEVHAKVTPKIPKRTRKGTTFFIDEKSFQLTRLDPKQPDMFETERTPVPAVASKK